VRNARRDDKYIKTFSQATDKEHIGVNREYN